MGESLQGGLALLFLFFLFYVVFNFMAKPLRFLAKLVINSLLGLLLLCTFNFIGGYFGFTVPLNWLTVLVAGFLGLPGLMLLVFFRWIL